MILRQIILPGFVKYILTMILVAQLVACGGSDGGDAGAGVASDGSVSLPAGEDIMLSGSVGDGPVTGATIMVYNSQGEAVGSMISDNTAAFRQAFKLKGKDYPLLLEVNGGIDLVTGSVPDFQMVSVMLNPSDKQVNINPFTTLAVRIAESLPGGINSVNVSLSMNLVLSRLAFGLDLNLVPDPITTTITEQNVSSLVKASEALGEMVRRTRDRMSAGLAPLSGDDVVAALAADMVDGFLDGVGAAGTNPRISAVANVVSAQVLIEAMSNTLKVGGVVATDVIDQAIAITNSQILSSQLTGSVRITAGLLKQARVSLNAIQVLDSSGPVVDVAGKVKNITADVLPQDVAAVLPPDASGALDYAVVLSPTADESQISAINQVVLNDGSDGVAPVNAVPVISGSPAVAVSANSVYGFQPEASDTDGDSLSFSIANKPGWASFSAASGFLGGTPDDSDVGIYSNIVISVTDGVDSASLPAFSIRVDEVVVPNVAPIIYGSPAGSVIAGSSYKFQPGASDGDGDNLSFSIANKPGWASFNTMSGLLSGTPENSDAATYSNILISVTDGIHTSSLAAFSIRVDEAVIPNSAPTISGSPAGSVVAGSDYVFQPSASDANGDTLSFSISNKPGWASFSTGTGRLSGTPNNGDTGTYGNVVIAVSDGQQMASLPAFSISVEPSNTAPTISGSPAGSVVVGSGYAFQPNATDADGDDLSFTISNKPGWASFSPGTGHLNGTPASGDTGAYGNIVIAVTDGQEMVSLPAFSITVEAAQPEVGGFTLNWTAPTARADGAPLSLADIDGYHIYLGNSPGNYSDMIDVADGTAQSASVLDLPVGTYYLVMTTYDNTGLESAYSGEIAKIAQ